MSDRFIANFASQAIQWTDDEPVEIEKVIRK